MHFSLFLLAASFGCALTAHVSATSQPALVGLWVATDSHGTIFNLVDTQKTNAAPVQGFDPSSSVVTASQWIFTNSTPNQFGTGTFLSYSTLITGVEAIRSQLVCNQNSTTWLFTAPKGMLIESKSGLAVTSYAPNSGESHPCTLEPQNSSDSAQIFSISPLT